MTAASAGASGGDGGKNQPVDRLVLTDLRCGVPGVAGAGEGAIAKRTEINGRAAPASYIRLYGV
jgi:hypothetical protein